MISSRNLNNNNQNRNHCDGEIWPGGLLRWGKISLRNLYRNNPWDRIIQNYFKFRTAASMLAIRLHPHNNTIHGAGICTLIENSWPPFPNVSHLGPHWHNHVIMREHNHCLQKLPCLCEESCNVMSTSVVFVMLHLHISKLMEYSSIKDACVECLWVYGLTLNAR